MTMAASASRAGEVGLAFGQCAERGDHGAADMALGLVQPVMGVEIVDLGGEREGRTGQRRDAPVEEKRRGVLCVRRGGSATAWSRAMRPLSIGAAPAATPSVSISSVAAASSAARGCRRDRERRRRCGRRSWSGHLQQLAETRNGFGRCQGQLQGLEQHRLVRGDHGLAEARFDIRDAFDGPHVGAGQDDGLASG
jgi:hypothetical protein